MICKNCGNNDAQIHHVTRSFGKNKNLLLIENIPNITCSHCGESYMTADTLYEIEHIKLHRKNFAKKKAIPVAVFE